MDQEDRSDHIPAARSQLQFQQPGSEELDAQQSRSSTMSAGARWASSSSSSSTTADTDIVVREDGLSNGTSDVGSTVASQCPADSNAAARGGHTDGMSEFSNNDLSLPEVCVSSNSNSFEENMNYEVQQAYRIFTGFLLDKHKGIASSFLQPIGHQEAQRGIGGVSGQGPAQLKQSMCLRRIEEKFVRQEYQTITEFVADFRLMLETCYRYHGVDHWISKQAQKMEIMLEQKLTLLSRTLREKTTLAVTSKGRFGAEEDRGSGGTSTRRRLAPRSLATITVGGHESIMVQTLRLEEQQRAKEEKRQRELEKKEAEEMSAKEVEEWEQSLLSQASPHTVDTLWELPAVGHFLCLAQTALNLPEIVFYELERCLLMPRCSILLSKIMTSLLSPWQRRATLHRRPPLPYRRWESELRQRVVGWYRTVGSARDQPSRAEQLGLCHQFFSVLGEVSPLEEKPFHLLVFYQRVWLLKGLCDHVYETNKDVQDAVLAQPIHECRESILGYDSKENAYIHFPHFCGADLRIYCQSPSTPPGFPFPSVWVKRVEVEQGMEGEESDALKDEGDKANRGCEGASMDTGESDDFGRGKAEVFGLFKRENGDEEEEEEEERFKSWSIKKEEGSESGSSDGNSSKLDLKIHTNSSPLSHTSPTGGSDMKSNATEETVELGHQSKRLTIKQEPGFSLGSERTIKAETQDPCLSVGEHCYTGRSPARSVNTASPTKPSGIKMEEGSASQGNQRSSCLECCRNKTSNVNSVQPSCCCGTSGPATQSSDSTQNSSEERVADRIWTKKKKWKKKRGREQLPGMKGENRQLQHVHRMSLYPAEAGKSAVRRVTTTIKRKDKKKNKKTGKKIESAKKIKDEPPVEPSFKLVCRSLEDLRELISKTEDELDDLESTKKRLGRWYYRREAVKELHSTLIRLLNELSPWEPKLVKAYQRNRLRLKKEFDDFKKHPEYNNFVREECMSSSSSSSEEDEEGSLGKELGSLEHYRRTEEDLEHAVPRGLWSGASTREIVAESAGDKTTYVSPNHLKLTLASPEKGFSVLPRPHTDIASPGDSSLQPSFELIPPNQSRDSNSAAKNSAQASLSPRATILHPTTGLPKGYTPIPTLLAKSVGNKVTLMKRPVDSLAFKSIESKSKMSLVSSPTSAMATTKLSKAQSSLSSSQQNSDQLQGQGLQQTQVLLQQGFGTVTAALLKPPQAKPIQTVPKNPVQVVYKVAEGLGHLVRNDSNPVKVSLHPVLDQNTGEKIMQQVVILPSNLLIHKSEEKGSSYNQPPTKGIQVPVPKVESPICMSTNVPGFTIPESRIPVQQVAPLKDTRTPRTPSPSVPPCLQHGTLKTAFKESQISSPQTSTPQVIKPNSSPISTPMSATPVPPAKSPDHKQELKTVCIRDSQSILVTTRGGNTGIVKVQTSSDQNAFGCLPTSPVITISPQFKAFLLSKTQIPASAPSQTSSCSVPAVASISVAKPQNQLSPLLKSPSTVATPLVSGLAGSIPVPGPGSQTTGTAVASSQGSNNATGSTVVTKVGQMPQPSLVKSTVVPSLSSTSVPQVLTQTERISKPGVKRTSTEERSQVTKFILVTPTSSSASNVSPSKETSSSSKSGVMFINQPTGTSQTTFMGNVQKQAIATGASTQLPTPSLSSQTLKMGLNLGQPVCGLNVESLSKVKNFTLPAGLHIQLSGKTTTIGQTIGALSHSSSKSTPVSISDTGCSPETSTQLAPFTSSNTTTSCPAKLHMNNYQLQGVSSFTSIPQLGSSTSASAPLPAAIMTKNDCNLPVGILPSKSAQVTPTMQSITPKDTDTYATQPQNMQTNFSEETTSTLVSPQLSLSKTQTATTNHTPFTTSSTVQQRIVINTSTPLAAGTQIFLNNARFVVPPQGLGPGSHVLIISNPAPQKVPSTIATGIGAAVPPQGASHVTVAPRAPILPQSPARLPGVPAVSSPFVACTPTVSPSLLATAPSVKPVQLTGAPPSQTSVVTALPRLPTSQICNFASPPVNSPTLVSSSPQLGGQISTLVPSASGLGSTLATFRLATGMTSRAECLASISPTVAPTFSKLSAALAPSPVLPSTSAITLPITVVPSAPHSSPEQQEVSVTTVDAAGRIAAASTTTTQSPALLSSTLIKKQGPGVIHPVLASTRSQILPTVSLPPVVSTVSRMQTLPIATVPPIGGTINVFETSPVVTTPPSSSTVFITPAQPVASLKTNSAIHQPIVVTNPALGKHSMHTSSLGLHNSVASKLLISPDGAVLSTVQVNPAELTGCPKPLAALMVSPNSSTGALHTHDSYLQPPQTDTSRTN